MDLNEYIDMESKAVTTEEIDQLLQAADSFSDELDNVHELLKNIISREEISQETLDEIYEFVIDDLDEELINEILGSVAKVGARAAGRLAKKTAKKVGGAIKKKVKKEIDKSVIGKTIRGAKKVKSTYKGAKEKYKGAKDKFSNFRKDVKKAEIAKRQKRKKIKR